MVYLYQFLAPPLESPGVSGESGVQGIISSLGNVLFYLVSPPSWLTEVIFPIKIIFLAVSAFFLGVILFVMFKAGWLKLMYIESLAEFLTFKPYGVKRYTKEWRKIIKRLETGSETEFKLAIVEADNFLAEILQRVGYKGDTFEERLKQVSLNIITNADKILDVHKKRNEIVRNPDYRLTLEETREILDIYEKALRDLDVI